MSENKTAADAPEMARDALNGEYGLTATSDEQRAGQKDAALSDIAALPPAPLPPDVVALVREARADGVCQIAGFTTEYRNCGKCLPCRAAALPLPEDADGR